MFAIAGPAMIANLTTPLIGIVSTTAIGRLGDAARAAQRVHDDGDAGIALGVDGDVLPAAPAAPGAPRRARREHAVG